MPQNSFVSRARNTNWFEQTLEELLNLLHVTSENNNAVHESIIGNYIVI